MSAESAADRAGFFDTDDFAVAGVWTLAAGGDTSLNVILDREDRVEGFGDVGMQVAVPVARCAVADLPGGYAKGDTLVAASTTWTVERIDLDIDRVMATVTLRAT